jgi:hypothetical protein
MDPLALATRHFEQWTGDEPLAVQGGVLTLELGVDAVARRFQPDPSPETWARLLDAATSTLGALIALSAHDDAALARRATAQADRLRPLLERAAGELTQRLGKTWRTS